jgi:hypothetical protein
MELLLMVQWNFEWLMKPLVLSYGKMLVDMCTLGHVLLQ